MSDPQVSVVIPMMNEAENAAPLIGRIVAACADVTFEIVAVNDGSSDATGAELVKLAQGDRRIRVLQHPRPAGQSAAVHSGVGAARAAVCVTLDGDGQNPPEELPKLYGPLLADTTGRLGLVAGQRVDRQDTASKRWASKFANGLRARILKDGTRDTGCGLKGFRRDAFLALPFFNHMHRYLPALMRRDGWEVAHVDVTHAERAAGRSKYNNLGRALVGIYDLIGVAWLIKRRKTQSPTEVTPEVTPDG
ncbi:glycosyltransferase family 2 protein [Vannielia litorea]|uniref:Dolichol-phosphate mannosyltransferase n=1 Tax=Vannielia litorea TaxID=1217970 RepID=A0A1N6HME8_9RHOB|nr:glycosyltransferase family 2 protein [Vannielia litorea]SIO20913.1 dolichol-phosphate mannosyltransferase [Vannielia litorea]